MQIFNLIKTLFSTNYKKINSAFTAAEILLIVLIIGVVFSITIPGFIANIEKEKVLTKLKVTYMDINQAIKNSEFDNGSIDTWDRTIVISAYFDRYIAPYLQILSTEISTITTTSYKKISNGYETTNQGYSQLKPNQRIKKYDLQNGSQVFVSDTLSNIVAIYIDINGNAQPNKFGKDVFMYRIAATTDTKGIKLVPFGYLSTSEYTVNPPMQPTREFLKTGSGFNYGCNKTDGRGLFCGALIMRDNWKIKSDYPW